MKKLYVSLAVVLILVITGCKTLSSGKAITSFSFASLAVTGTITEATHTIAITVPLGTDVTALVPTITHNGESINPATGVANNFTGSVTYTVTAEDATIQTYVVTVTGNILGLVTVPAGSFQRDDDPDNISIVTTAFLMSEKEITRAQFLAITGVDPSNATYSTGVSDPVQMVTWYDAVEFCNLLSIAEGLTPVYTISGRIPEEGGYPITFATVDVPDWFATGYRLPTEMEWEWAAMGATSGSGYVDPTYLTGYGKLFAGSNATNAAGDNGTNVIGDYAVFGYSTAETGRTTTARSNPVGSKLPNELGLYDMSGNVGEWCWDWYAPYTVGILSDDRGPASGWLRVTRGGSWSSSASNATVANRDYYPPDYQPWSLGFRVVRP
jgi:formylglycine-generating enzyme required for sulfatase activity